MSEPHEQLRPAQDEVLRKIGRNVLMFQQLEACLKFLLTNASAYGTSADLKQRRQDRAESISKQMMGKLVEAYLRDILSDVGEPTQEPQESSQIWMSFSFRLQVDEAFRSEQRLSLASIVEQRNELIHNFLPRWNGESLEALQDAADYLDAQRDGLLPVLESSQRLVQVLTEALQELVKFMTSDEGHEALGFGKPHGKTLLEVLGAVANERARADGWTYLALAGQVLRSNALDLLIELKSKHGGKTLKALLAAENLIDLRDEQLPSGSFRTLYRLRDGQSVN